MRLVGTSAQAHQQGGTSHRGHFCSAPLLADTAGGAPMPQSQYASLGHLSRFVRPGARSVLCVATREVLECTAFANPDGAVVMDRSETQQHLRAGGRQPAREHDACAARHRHFAGLIRAGGRQGWIGWQHPQRHACAMPLRLFWRRHRSGVWPDQRVNARTNELASE